MTWQDNRGYGVEREERGENRRIWHDGDHVATMLEVMGRNLVLIFQYDALACPGPLGT